MKILLVQSYMGKREPAIYPIGLACIKSSLTNSEVRVFDPNTSKDPLGELQTILLDFRPEVVGISLRNIDSTNKRTVVYYYPYLGELLSIIKSVSRATVVVGGSGFSMFAAEIMQMENRIDYGVYLEGESIFPALIENLHAPEQVPSIYYRKNGTVHFTGTAPPCDPDRLPRPDWGILPLAAYPEKNGVGVETKRGCALNCIYCVYGFLNGKKYRLKNPSLVVDEIVHLVTRCKAERFMFVDSVFNYPKTHAEAICREIVKRGVKVKWSAWFNEANITEEFLELVSQAGCDSIMLSPDALADPVLKTLGKNLSRKQVIATYRLLRRFNRFDISYNFFKNPPGQTLGNFIAIILFCLHAKWQMGSKVHFEFNSLRIEPHTRLFEIALGEGVISESTSLLFPTNYVNRRTWFIGAAFDLLLAIRGR